MLSTSGLGKNSLLKSVLGMCVISGQGWCCRRERNVNTEAGVPSQFCQELAKFPGLGPFPSGEHKLLH